MAKSERRRAPKRQKHDVAPEAQEFEKTEEEPSWVQEQDSNTPFGLVAPPMQSYFKEVNSQLTELQRAEAEDGESEEVKILLQAALSEMDGHELMMATDPTCSLVLENMIPLLDEKALRVLLDRMTGRYVL